MKGVVCSWTGVAPASERVHSGTAPERERSYACWMRLQRINAALAMICVGAAITIGLRSLGVTELIDWLMIAVLGIVAPLAIWFWWHDPDQTMSQRIHEGRDARP